VRRSAGAICAALLFFSAAIAAAQDRAPPRPILLLVAPGGDHLAGRIRAEAAALGVAIVHDATAAWNDRPEVLCQRHRVIGVLRVWSDVHATLFLESSTTAAAVQDRFDLRSDDGQTSALRIVEEIRAHIVDRAEAATSPRTAAAAVEPAPPGIIKSPAAPSPRVGPGGLRFEASGGFAAGFWSSDVGASLHWVAALGARTRSGVGVTLRGTFPVRVRDITASEGTVEWRPILTTAEISVELLRRSRWALTAAAEGGAMFLDLAPTAAPGFSAAPDAMVVAIALLGLGTRVELTDWLALRGALSLGATAPRPVAQIDGRAVGQWGRPVLFFSITTELGWSRSAGGGSP
jgi:hypothetical protein